ncbi:efflux RND transporter periplasmic adaptor subunit [Methylobacterium sp. J-048]|uniref:efflux RND transporter periplasmic adaptor subunit n=1 Tax=Methylobacterium sp. J-048 TaxID=2836635 RepID=UPI001FB86A5C|nr:efflux RND transporter periplasmic adaptor subunit [Methylobacterium sp. J-048]MCJ2056972.1 efflux RND transporter periplasmic adaptor subunit [Methylobacterium sp. J-048]
MARWLPGNLMSLGIAAISAFALLTYANPDVGLFESTQRGSPAAAAVNEAAAPAFEAGRFITAPIQRGSLEQLITATGTVQPVDTVEVGSQLPGQIARLYVDFNDRVRLGDPLAELDQRSFKAKVEENRAALDMALANVKVQQARLDRARIDLDNARGNKAVLQAKVESAQAVQLAAERNLDRKMTLRSREVASPASLEEAQTDLASRKAQTREASSILDLNGFAVEAAVAEVRRLEAEFTQARAAVPQRQASLKGAEIDLDRTVIRSPTDGVVVGRFVNQGQTLAAGLEVRTAFNIAKNLAEMEVHARVDETDIGRVAAGQRATFGVDAYPGRRFEAVVRQVRKAPLMTQNVVTYTVVLKTDNRDGLLLPGMTALVKLTIHKDEDVLKVPLAALRFRPEGTAPRDPAAPAVWVRAADGSLEAVRVETGSTSADLVALRAGGRLAEGSEVVVGQAEMRTGRRLFGVRLGF